MSKWVGLKVSKKGGYFEGFRGKVVEKEGGLYGEG
jgi:hypothetical protein